MFQNFGANFIGGAKGEGVLGINTGTPKAYLAAKFSLDRFRVHILGRPLHWVEDIKSGFNEGWDQGEDSAIRMHEGLPGGVLVDPIIEHFMMRHEQFPVGLGRHERAVLGGKDCPGQEDRVISVANHFKDFLDVRKGNLTLTFENGVDIIFAGHSADVPFF